RRYDPGWSAAKLYSPLSFVTVVRDRLVASFVSMTSTPGTRAPPASRTAPRRPPWKPCPNELIASNRPNRTKQNVPRNFIVSSTLKRESGLGRRILSQAVKFVNFVPFCGYSVLVYHLF